MRKTILLASLALAIPLSLLAWAQVRRWKSPVHQRVVAAAFADSDVRTAAVQRFGADNDLFGFEVTDLGPVTGGKEYEVRLIFDPVGTVPDRGDVTAVVFVSTDLSESWVVSHEDSDPDSAEATEGGEINNSIEFTAASVAFSDSEVQGALDTRFEEGVVFTDVDVVIAETGEAGTIVDVIMDSDSLESGLGDVTATVLVSGSSGTVVEVTGE